MQTVLHTSTIRVCLILQALPLLHQDYVTKGSPHPTQLPIVTHVNCSRITLCNSTPTLVMAEVMEPVFSRSTTVANIARAYIIIIYMVSVRSRRTDVQQLFWCRLTAACMNGARVGGGIDIVHKCLYSSSFNLWLVHIGMFIIHMHRNYTMKLDYIKKNLSCSYSHVVSESQVQVNTV